MHVFYSTRFKKQYKKLAKDLQKKVKERVALLTGNPGHPLLDNHVLKEPYAGCRSINITGDYRAISEPHPNFAHFIALGTHHELYGK
jgi:mRNA-degrading endonuclease YafQ of YafQ-DinJ toxin-antitoxin module